MNTHADHILPASQVRKAHIALAILCHPTIALARRRYILVAGHMRSYSSLLCHILGSHPNIRGYAERHQDYVTPLDFLRLRYKTFMETGSLECSFLLDKILHDRHRVSDATLDRRNMHMIILVRRPAATIKSIMHMGKQLAARGEWTQNQVHVLAYYRQRLETLTRYAQRAAVRPVLVEAERLKTDTSAILDHLSSCLGLIPTLSPAYSKFRNTGSPGYGDPSDTIRSGIILEQDTDYSEIALRDDILTQAEAAYSAAMLSLSRACTSASSQTATSGSVA